MKEVVASLKEQLVGLREEIHKGEEIREGNQQKMTGETKGTNSGQVSCTLGEL